MNRHFATCMTALYRAVNDPTDTNMGRLSITMQTAPREMLAAWQFHERQFGAVPLPVLDQLTDAAYEDVKLYRALWYAEGKKLLNYVEDDESYRRALDQCNSANVKWCEAVDFWIPLYEAQCRAVRETYFPRSVEAEQTQPPSRGFYYGSFNTASDPRFR